MMPAGGAPAPATFAAEVGQIVAAMEQSGNHGVTITFMVEAVKDIQQTIHALDTKIGILLAALAIPIPFVKGTFDGWHARGFAWSATDLLSVLALAAYSVAALVAVQGLTGIGNASLHVDAEQKPDSVFYAGGLFELGLTDAFLTRSALRSTRSLETFITAIPGTFDAAVAHLAHEVMSLAYIRDLKVHRQKLAFLLTSAALILGFAALVV